MPDAIPSSPWRVSEKGAATIIAGTPPTLRRTLEFDDIDDSDLDELDDERIPATSPFITQPTQIITQPTQILPARTTLRKPDSSSQIDNLVPSSPPPRPCLFPTPKDGVPTKDQSISRFFKRALPISPKMAKDRPSVPDKAHSPSTIPAKRKPMQLIEISSDSEDEDFGGRADIRPTAFARKVRGHSRDVATHMGTTNGDHGATTGANNISQQVESTAASPEKQPPQSKPGKLIDFQSYRYSPDSQGKAKNMPKRKLGGKASEGVILLDSSDSEDDLSPAPVRRRRLVQGSRRREPSPTSSRLQSSPSTHATTPEGISGAIVLDEPEAQLQLPESEDELLGEPVDEDSDDYDGRESSPAICEGQEGRLLKLMNELELNDLMALTAEKEAHVKLLLKARPFASIADVEKVCKWTDARGPRKRQRIEIGEDIVEKTRNFLRAIEKVDKIVAEAEKRATFIKAEIGSWGMNSHGGKPSASPESTSPARKSRIKGKSIAFAGTQPCSMKEDLPMHDFQIFGVNWMNLLYANGYGGILADDMGLGKTCQVIGLMARMKDDWDGGELQDRPFPNLIVVPPSTLDNWMSEFEKFAPDLNVVKYSGSQMARMEIAEALDDDDDDTHVIVTSYSQLGQIDDIRALNGLALNAAIFDEAQELKNPTTQRYERLNKLRTEWRLLLSGTPIQNHLMEMISMLRFVDQDLFDHGDEDIRYVFDHKIHTRNLSNTALLYGERVDRARSILEPFILQRRKDQVGQNLPPKMHSIVYCDLPEDQKAMYDVYEKRFRSDPAQRQGKIAVRGNDLNNIWMQLKKAALHPQLFRRHFTDDMAAEMADILFANIPAKDLDLAQPKKSLLLDDLKSRSDFDLHLYCQDFPGLLKEFDIPGGSWTESGKVRKLLELVDQYQKNGDRVLVFSKFTKVIEILSYTLAHSNIRHCTLTGDKKVGERQDEINTFQTNSDIPVFLLTTGAGGTGINLTAANKVVIFDMSSNPQDDKQAENRAHRLGQTRPVEIVHLVAKDTIEELIYQTCQKKIELADKVTNTNGGGDDESRVRAAVRGLLEEKKGKMN
jgi:SWI/SNF-related matrix-associated actin-dependent regulator of chromatin subfamily A containing DEAD/H box 1